MGLLFKTKDKKPTSMEIKQAVEANVISQSRWRPIADLELDGALAELSKHVAKKEASKPSWARRLGIMLDGSGYVLTVEVCNDAIIGAPWFPARNCPPQCIVAGFPLAYGVELLGSPLSPEIELNDRRRRFEDFQKKEDEKRAAEAEKLRKFHADRESEYKIRTDCRAGDWALLNSLQRFAVRLAVTVEPRDAALAGDLRKLVSDSLSGADDDTESWPRSPSWFTGLGLDELSPERRQDLQIGVQAEREVTAWEQVPPGKKPALQALSGGDRSAGLAHWRQIRAVQKKSAGEPDYVSPGRTWSPSSVGGR
jgi:hypothetical protein